MPADAPTILATSGGRVPGRRTPWEVGPLTEYAVELAGVTGRAPRVCFLATALGDNAAVLLNFYDAARFAGYEASHLALFPMPNVDDIRGHLLAQDVIWVWGGSVAGLLAMWRLHGLDDVMREAWEAGVVLTGVSAGSICWHVGGPTDSFGPDLRAVTTGLGLVPYANGVHYDSEEQRRPLLHRLVEDGTLPTAYATDDGVGLHYRGTELVEALTEIPGQGAYRVERGPDGAAVETRIEPRLLPGSSLTRARGHTGSYGGAAGRRGGPAAADRAPRLGPGRARRRAGARRGQAALRPGGAAVPGDGTRQRRRPVHPALAADGAVGALARLHRRGPDGPRAGGRRCCGSR